MVTDTGMDVYSLTEVITMQSFKDLAYQTAPKTTQSNVFHFLSRKEMHQLSPLNTSQDHAHDHVCNIHTKFDFNCIRTCQQQKTFSFSEE